MIGVFAVAICIVFNELVNGDIAITTRYWDCCRPACSARNIAPVNQSVLSCSIDGWHSNKSKVEDENGCFGGTAFACNFHMPWAVSDTLAYGFAAANIQGQDEPDWCCSCYELTFVSKPIQGKKMIVQVINTVRGSDQNHFNFQIPGAGVGTNNGCKTQWNASDSGWGRRWGGVDMEQECQQLPHEIRAGCLWRFEWFKGADNPPVEFRPVVCPKELVSKTLCQRDDSKEGINGTAYLPFKNRHPNRNSSYWYIYVIAIPLAILLVSSIPTFFMYKYRTKYLIITKLEINAFFKGDHENVGDGSTGENVANTMSYDKDLYEVSPTSFKVDFTQCLGAGEFGKVCLGTVKRGDGEEQVAVKMTKKVSRGGGSFHEGKFALKGLLTEIKILAYIGKHQHVATLVGAYTGKLHTGHVLVFLELCKVGSLQKYLQNLSQSKSDNKETAENESKLLDPEVFTDLQRWTVEIAEGMEYLALKRLVHADLATRNVLLDANKTAKIADFGLSRRLYDYTNYVKQQNQEPMPWRWMAPECLRKLVFNEKTDVWAMGVTLWEMYTLGDLPYPGLNWEGNFPSRLEKGLRLEEPKYNESGIYLTMLKCWNTDPDKRPTFSVLKEVLKNNIGQMKDEMYGRGGSLAEEENVKCDQNQQYAYTVLEEE